MVKPSDGTGGSPAMDHMGHSVQRMVHDLGLDVSRLSTRPLPQDPAYILIGMAAAGKSTVGPALAVQLQCSFIDTDALLSTQTRCSLEDLLRNKGPEAFCDAEEAVIRTLAPTRAVIATGGSLIYRPRAIEHLQRVGVLLWLDTPASAIIGRLRSRDPRGLIRLPAHVDTLEELIQYRQPLYAQAADYRLAARDHAWKTTREA